MPVGQEAHRWSIRRRETNPSGAPTPSKGSDQSAHALQDGCGQRRWKTPGRQGNAV